MTDWLTTEEAAARLGVKRETLYAYVSRGLVHREMDLDGRSSRFDPVEIDRLRDRARRTASGELATIISTRLTRLVPTGHTYRGRSAIDLARVGTDFEEIADLLWDDRGRWDRPSPSALVVEPTEMPPLDRFRIAVARASAADGLRADLEPAAVAQAGRSIIGAMVDALPVRGQGPDTGRVADRLWARLTVRTATPAGLAALNAALVLLADHGLAASTFAVRLAASVRADPYSAVITGLGAVGGQLHGAASGGVHRLLARAAQLGSAELALGELLQAGLTVPGCGHAVYGDGDPREELLTDLVRTAWAGDERLGIVDGVRAAAGARGDRFPNIDMALGALTWMADAAADAGEATFAIARTAGWLAHAIEESAEPPLRFRTEARHLAP